MADHDDTETTPSVIMDYVPLTSTKQNRIMIWRDEVVASSTIVSPPTPSSESSSLAPSSTNTTSSSSSFSSFIFNRKSQPQQAITTVSHIDDPLAASHNHNRSRRSRLWRRLNEKLKKGGLGSIRQIDPLDEELRRREEVRTSMYQDMWAAMSRDLGGDDGFDSKTLERFARAERLLKEGVVNKHDP